MTTPANRQVVLAKRPGASHPVTPDCFKVVECAYPVLDDEHVIVRNMLLSIDPAMRCCLNEDSGVEYIKAVEVGGLIRGFGGVGVIEQVGNNLKDTFSPGDLVTGSMLWAWQSYFLADKTSITKADLPPGLDPSVILSCLGLSGLTSYIGLKEKAHIDVAKKQTVVISGAAGSCGILAGQISRLMGADRVMGICGTDEKCAKLKDLGFDATINYKTENVSDRLTALCPNGVHVYFDNVGGEISEAVVVQMVTDSHVVLCGQISQYEKNVPYPPPISDQMQAKLKQNNITRERFLVLNYADQFTAAQAQLCQWLATGKLKVHCTVAEGLDQAGQAFCEMMTGKNFGKQIVKL